MRAPRGLRGKVTPDPHPGRGEGPTWAECGYHTRRAQLSLNMATSRPLATRQDGAGLSCQDTWGPKQAEAVGAVACPSRGPRLPAWADAGAGAPLDGRSEREPWALGCVFFVHSSVCTTVQICIQFCLSNEEN